MFKTLVYTILLLSPALYANNNTRQTQLDTLVQRYTEGNNQTAILLLEDKHGDIHKSASGFADREKQIPIKTDDMFEIGSASKIFTAIAVFQLIEEGKLSLDTTLDTLYPTGKIQNLANYKGKNYWSKITVGMLLNHTSGLVDYLNVYGNDDKAIDVFSKKAKVYTFESIIDLTLNFGEVNFKPGEQFRYCNTGYLLLGDIISKRSGMEWHDYIQTHIFDVAGVKHTYFGTRISKILRAQMPKGYNKSHPTHMPMSLASSAGEIISTLSDLDILINAWREGKYYKKTNTLHTQLTQGFHTMDPNIKAITYGYGVMKVGDFYGHGGQTFGFESYVTTNLKTNTTYIVGTNDAQVRSLNLFLKAANIQIYDNDTLNQKCTLLTKQIENFRHATEINHKNIHHFQDILHNKNSTEADKKNARTALQILNKQTANRMPNSGYPALYEQFKQSFEVTCGIFSPENNASLITMIHNSMDFNTVLARELGDKFSVSRVQ